MSRGVTTPRGVWTTCVVVVLLLNIIARAADPSYHEVPEPGTVTGSGDAEVDRPGGPRSAPAPEPASATRALAAQQADGPSEPDVAACVDGFLIAREWVSSMAPPSPDDAASGLTLPGVRGVSVILRHEGRLVGVGEDWPGGGAGDDRMLRRAVGRAIARALGDRVIAALPAEARAEAGKRLAIELEFAGRPEPLLGRTIAECAVRIEPGLDGLAVRRSSDGKPSWAIAFPSRLQATNVAGASDRTLISLLVDLGLPAKDLPELARIEPVGVFRFASLRLAQPTPEATPTLRGRGAARIRDAEVTSASIAAHAERVLRRLASTRFTVTDPHSNEVASVGLGIAGDYLAVADDHKPVVAPPGEQAIAAWAAAATSSSPHVPEAVRTRARSLAVALLTDLAQQRDAEEPPMATAPAMTFAICAITALGSEAELDEHTLDMARAAREKLALIAQAGTPNDRALACLGAAVSLGTERRFLAASDLRSKLDAAWTSGPPDSMIGQFPWLVLSEAAYARTTGEPVAHSTTARAIARLLFAVQAGFGELTAQQDLRGGLRLGGARRNGVTAQSLRPGLGLVAMLGYPGFVADDGMAMHRERTIALLRFVEELTVDDEQSRYLRNPQRSLDGVREALWDSNQRVAANAMAVLVDIAALEALAVAAGSDSNVVATPEAEPLPEPAGRE